MANIKNGTIIQYVFDKKNIYMVLGILDDTHYLMIRVRRKDGRFDIKRFITRQISLERNYSKIFDENEFFGLDKRDQDIFEEFRAYVKNCNISFSTNISSFTYKHFNPPITINSFKNVVLMGIDLKKYKDYCKNI